MAVFLGVQTPTLGIALLCQAAVTGLALLVYLYFTARTLRRVPWSQLISVYRRTVPAWGWFMFWSINSLMIAGEGAFAITAWTQAEVIPPLKHAPLLCGLACTCALLAMYVFERLDASPLTESD